MTIIELESVKIPAEHQIKFTKENSANENITKKIFD